MLVFALASLLVAPSAEQPWSVTLRPAVVVKDADEPAAPATVEEGSEATPAPLPALAPAKAEKPKLRAPKKGVRRISVLAARR